MDDRFMHPHRTHLQRFPAGLALALLLCAAGCGASSDANAVNQGDTRGQDWTIVRDSDKPVAVVDGDGRELPFENGRVIVDDKIILLDGDEKIEVYRTPNAIVNERSALPFLYLKEDSLEHVVTEGCQGTAYVDPSDGRMCWPAMVCENPQCPARTEGGPPVLLIHILPGAIARPDGTIRWDTTAGSLSWDTTAGDEGHVKCPHCNLYSYIKRHLHPDEAAGREHLDAELAKVRAAMRRAKASR